MRRTRSTTLAALAVLALSAGVAAQQTVQDRTTFVTFSARWRSRQNAAGRHLHVPARRHAGRPAHRAVLDKEKGKLIATMLAVPAERAEQSGEPVVTFNEAPSNRAPRCATGTHAGERAGNEFVYPRTQAMQIAQASGESVMSIRLDLVGCERLEDGVDVAGERQGRRGDDDRFGYDRGAAYGCATDHDTADNAGHRRHVAERFDRVERAPGASGGHLGTRPRVAEDGQRTADGRIDRTARAWRGTCDTGCSPDVG